jgi:hypothetical protein
MKKNINISIALLIMISSNLIAGGCYEEKTDCGAYSTIPGFGRLWVPCGNEPGVGDELDENGSGKGVKIAQTIHCTLSGIPCASRSLGVCEE